ncbi:thioesterase family protein [Mycobacterium sp. NBC_00419]|uniref:acyl-CoA thioesterase domain-containing protein n=1 Tax=Mycobacterium sp. NBC_00419 TaxID=2975989 RepID=UPI002E22B771
MRNGPAHFTAESDGTFHPTRWAQSRWGEDMLNGPAVVALAAWSLEREYGLEGFLPGRLTVDLFKAARKRPTHMRTRLIRDGHRIRNSECDVIQGETVVARATLVQYRTSEPPPGEEWIGDGTFAPPQQTHDNAYLIGSDGAGWDTRGGEHQNTTRKRFYHKPIDAVAGQGLTPFVRAVIVAEATSLVCNLGTKGIGYINGDLTVALTRLPQSHYIGLQAETHWAADGVSVGTATLHDEHGPFGTGMVTAIANPAAQLDFGGFNAVPNLQV